MKVKFIGPKKADYLVKDNNIDLTYGKVYDVIHQGDDGSWYGIIDDSEDDEYAYPASFFEVVEE